MSCPFNLQGSGKIVYFIDITNCNPGCSTGAVIKKLHRESISTIFDEYDLVEPMWVDTKLPTLKRKA